MSSSRHYRLASETGEEERGERRRRDGVQERSRYAQVALDDHRLALRMGREVSSRLSGTTRRFTQQIARTTSFYGNTNGLIGSRANVLVVPLQRVEAVDRESVGWRE